MPMRPGGRGVIYVRGPTTALHCARRGYHHSVGLNHERGGIHLYTVRRQPRARQSAHHEPSDVTRNGGQHRAAPF
jgi:hypothetical protein